MSRSHLFMAALLAGAIAGAAADLPAGYEMHTDEEKIVFSEDFSQGMGSWAPRSGGRPIVIAPAMGTNGSACAMSVRDDAAAHPKLVREFRGEPGKIYYVSLRFRSDNVSYADDEQYARSRVSIHPFWIDNFDAAGKYLSGCYLIVAIPEGQSNDWEEIGKEFVMPPGCVRSVITLGGYVPGEGRKITGTLYWDDIKIIRKGEQMATIYPLTPKQFNLGADGKVVFRVYDPQARDEKRLQLDVRMGNQAYRLPLNNGLAEVKFGSLPVGKHAVRLFLLDEETKKIAGSANCTFRVTAEGEGDFPGSTVSDEKGFLYVNGERFLPLVICSSPGSVDETVVQRVSEAGFTCLMPYSTLNLSLNAGDTKPRTIARLKRGLDYMHAHGLKVIVSLKEQIHNEVKEFEGVKGPLEICEYVVENLKQHPAIIAWYVADENPLGELPRVTELRQRISLIDPFHPVLTCTCVPKDHVYFAATGDIIWPDCYPIHGEESRSMASMRRHFVKATDARLGSWFALQAFSWGCLQYPPSKFRYPTEEELRSMALQCLNNDVKGFSFFSYSTIFFVGEKAYPGSSAGWWPKVTNVVQMLRELGPFTWTDEAAPELVVETSSKNFVEARAYKAGDKVCVVITGDGPGPAEAILKLPHGLELKSRYGRTVRLEDGAYRFTGMDICSDLLTNW